MSEKIIHGNIVTLHQTTKGNYWVPNEPEQDFIGVQMRAGTIFDEHVITELSSYITKDSVVLDIGANLGQMSLEFAKIAAEVHAFEAHPFLYDVMCLNFTENNQTNIIPYLRAVWDVDGIDLFYPNPDYGRFGCRGSWGVDITRESDENGVVCKSFTIDSLNLPRVDVVKIDAQGSDLRIMRGMKNTIARCKPIIVFEYEAVFSTSIFNEQRSDYINFIEEIGYEQIKLFSENYLIRAK